MIFKFPSDRVLYPQRQTPNIRRVEHFELQTFYARISQVVIDKLPEGRSVLLLAGNSKRSKRLDVFGGLKGAPASIRN
jgi:hypothetical protein